MKAMTWQGPATASAAKRPAAWLTREDELLFAADPAEQGERFADAALALRRIDRASLRTDLSDGARQHLFAGAGAVHHAGMERGDVLYAVCRSDGTVLHHSFVQFAARCKILLGEPDEVPLIGRCATDPSARGQRLYPRTLRHIMAELAAAGHRRVVIYCDSDNLASIHGIEHAGFRRVCRLHSLMIGDCWSVQLRTPPGRLRLIRY